MSLDARPYEELMTVTVWNRIAKVLESHPDFRVLRRYQRRDRYQSDVIPKERLARGVILDTETTGCDQTNDRIIELALLSFTFDRATGALYEVVERYDALEDPGMPIDPAATRVHGITDEMVRGRRIDDARVAALTREAEIVIAHYAAFDRAFCERRFALFKDLPWSCSGTQIPWAEEGIGSTKLEYLAWRAGFFYDAHRAAADCDALLEVLGQALPASRVTGLERLWQVNRREELRLWAVGAPFECKEQLNRHGYNHWGDGTRGQEKAWCRMIAQSELEAELNWLRVNIFDRPARIVIDRVDAFSRFSPRRVGTHEVRLA